MHMKNCTHYVISESRVSFRLLLWILIHLEPYFVKLPNNIIVPYEWPIQWSCNATPLDDIEPSNMIDNL